MKIRLAVVVGLAGCLAACKNSGPNQDQGILEVEDSSGNLLNNLSYDFGQVCVGLPAQRTLSLDATSTEVTINFITISPSGAFSLVSPPSFPFNISGGSIQNLVVAYNPPSGSSGDVATLTITSDALSPKITVNLVGEVSNAPAIPTASTSCIYEPDGGSPRQPCDFLSFNGVNLGSAVDLSVTVSNQGCSALTLAPTLALTFPTTGTNPFSLVGTPPTQVALGSPATLKVHFAPTTNISYTGNLDLHTNDPTQNGGPTIALTGAGQAAAIQIVPVSDQGDTGSFIYTGAVQNVPFPAKFYVVNNGTSAVNLQLPEFTGGNVDAGVYVISGVPWSAGTSLPPLGGTVGSNQTASFTVTFNSPGSSATPFIDTLEVPYSGGSTGTATLLLSADTTSGICFFNSQGVTISQLELPKSDAGVCGSSSATFQIRDCGTGADLLVSQISNTVANYDLTTQPPLPVDLSASDGGVLDVTVTFHDNGRTESSPNTLVVTSNAEGSPATNFTVNASPDFIPPPSATPVLDAGSGVVGTQNLFVASPGGVANEWANYNFVWSFGTTGPDAGTIVASPGGGDVATITAYIPGVEYAICLSINEVTNPKYGGNCGLDAGISPNTCSGYAFKADGG